MSDKGTKWRDKREGNPGEKFFFFFTQSMILEVKTRVILYEQNGTRKYFIKLSITYL